MCDDVDYTIQHIPRQSPERMLRLLLLLPWMPLKDVWNRDMLFWHGRMYVLTCGWHSHYTAARRELNYYLGRRTEATHHTSRYRDEGAAEGGSGQDGLLASTAALNVFPQKTQRTRRPDSKRRLASDCDIITWKRTQWMAALLIGFLFISRLKNKSSSGSGWVSSGSRWLLKKRRNQQQKSSFTDWWVEPVCVCSKPSELCLI